MIAASRWRSAACAAAALVAGALVHAQTIGPTYESLQSQPEVTRFLWWGHVRAPPTGEQKADVLLFVATDSSWLLLEDGAEISGVGPESDTNVPPPLEPAPEPIEAAEFERRTGPDVAEFAEFCAPYATLRGSLERYWEARRLWRGRVAMEQDLYVELFNAADGRWALLVHAPRLAEPARQACMPQRGFYSRLFEQPETASEPVDR